MRKIIGLCIFAMFCSGCTAEMMERRGDSIRLLVPKETRGGVVRYLNTGLQSWRRARRANAEKQMQTYCPSSYKILAEGPRSKFGASMPIGDKISFEVDQYWYISFECSQ